MIPAIILLPTAIVEEFSVDNNVQAHDNITKIDTTLQNIQRFIACLELRFSYAAH